MKNVIFFLVLTVATLSQANEVGFKNGNEKTAFKIEGDILVICDDPVQGTQFGNFHCEDDILTPSESDYFQGPEGIHANEVTLTAAREDGSSRSKSLEYSSQKNQSVKQFNLWISSLLQRPLLKLGKNHISYNLKNNGKTVLSGDFETLVKDGGIKTCRRRGRYHSNIGNDCMVGSGRFCNQFFSENKYCLN